MNKQDVETKKYSTYLSVDVIRAVKNLSHAKDVSAAYIIEAALRAKIPEKYWPAEEE